MKVTIISDIPVLPIILGQELEKHGVVVQQALPNKSNQLQQGVPVAFYGSGINSSDLKKLIDVMAPISINTEAQENIPKDEIQLHLIHFESFSEYQLDMKADTESFLEEMVSVYVDTLGFSEKERALSIVDDNELVYGSAPKLARQMIRWHLKTIGISVAERRKFREDDPDIYIRVKDPRSDQIPPRQRFKIHIASDDFALAKEFSRILTGAGYSIGKIGLLDEDDIEEAVIGYGAEWFDKGHFPAEIFELGELLTDFAKEKGIDLDRYPVKQTDDLSADMDAVICLPMKSCLNRTKRPYAGSFPERFVIKIYTDQGMDHKGLRQALGEVGYGRLKFSELDQDDRIKGFRVTCKKDKIGAQVHGKVREIVNQQMKKDEVPPEFKLEVDDDIVGDEEVIKIYYPLDGATDGRLSEEVASPRWWDCKLSCTQPEQWQPALDSLKSWGFKCLEISDMPIDDAKIRYGGAPLALLEKLHQHFRDQFAVDLDLEKSWSSSDDDIWIQLPARGTEKQSQSVHGILPGWYMHPAGPKDSSARKEFIRRQGRTLWIGDIGLSVRPGKSHPLVPPLKNFSHFCIDGKTADTLYHLALSLQLGEPCLLEGVTSTSKTSSIMFLAAMLNQPILRMNLNGQTDTSEMIGRFIPIVDEAGASGWQWQNGLLPQAMVNGHWLIYDEYNLGAPEIRERDNSVREFPPTLTLTEFDNALIGSSTHPVNPTFHLFATMNPAEYVGRQPMSPADRDRWQGYRFVSPPGEQEYADMLIFLATGQQPQLEIGGAVYRGKKQAPPIPQLDQIPEIEKLAKALAAMQVALERAANGNDESVLGGARKDGFIVSRRGLISLMKFLARTIENQNNPVVEKGLRQALYRYYLSRTTSVEDQDVVLGIFDAVGLGPHSWSL